jgi:hypothetical protein
MNSVATNHIQQLSIHKIIVQRFLPLWLSVCSSLPRFVSCIVVWPGIPSSPASFLRHPVKGVTKRGSGANIQCQSVVDIWEIISHGSAIPLQWQGDFNPFVLTVKSVEPHTRREVITKGRQCE